MNDNKKDVQEQTVASNKPDLAKPKQTTTDSNDDEYLAKLKGLNQSVSSWIKKHVDINPFINLKPIFLNYEKYFTELEKLKSTNAQPKLSPNKQANVTSPTNKSELSSIIFNKSPSTKDSPRNDVSDPKHSSSVGNKSDGTAAATNDSTSVPTFIFGSPSTAKGDKPCKPQEDKRSKPVIDVVPGTSTSIFSSTSKSVFPSTSKSVFTSTSKSLFSSASNAFPSTSSSIFPSTSTSIFPSTTIPSFTFGSNTSKVSTTTTASTGFSFGIPPPTTASTSAFSFGVTSPTSTLFSGLTKTKPQEQEQEVENKTEDDDSDQPPKVNFTPVVEEGSVYTIKCKVFVKKEGKFGDRGVGNLYLKPVPDSDKFQLIVRADTNLGNLLCNFILSENIPMQRMGTKDVMLVCLPIPDHVPPPTSVLLRVKSSEDADELLKVLEKHRK